VLEVVTVWAPRPDHPKFRDYLTLLEIQKKTIERVGHRHVVVTDGELPGYETIHVELPQPLMRAILVGQLAFLERWSGEHPAVLVDADCIVSRALEDAFSGEWDIGLTNRPSKVSPIQNGAMYFAPGSRAAALALFRRALELCGEHWGGDQEAISQAVAPVPNRQAVEERFGVRVGFLSTDPYNFTPGQPFKPRHDRFILHFKGANKHFAIDYARTHLKIRPGGAH
jgi:hypothetical protein